MFNGVDISDANGRVDWDKLKSNIDFTILCCGYGSDVISQDDKQWTRDVTECSRLNIPQGAYLYSYAINMAEAESEAMHALRLLEGLKPVYPVYIDMENADGYRAKHDGISKQMATAICLFFCERLTAAGYTVGVYANKDWATNWLDMMQLSKCTFWLAQYNDRVICPGQYDMWQYTSDGGMPGASGRVDLNYCCKDFFLAAVPNIYGLSLDTTSKNMNSGERYTISVRYQGKPAVTATGRDVIAVSEPRLDPKGRGWLIDVQGLPPELVIRHGHIMVTSGGQTVQRNFNVRRNTRFHLTERGVSNEQNRLGTEADIP